MARYQHDCDQCKPLGEHEEYDLYFCEQNGSPTVIARFGLDGDYLSGLPVSNSGVLFVAKTRAIAAGLLAPNATDLRAEVERLRERERRCKTTQEAEAVPPLRVLQEICAYFGMDTERFNRLQAADVKPDA